ncbi:CheR family methyltransferase [Flammeovirga sp. SubArs3]|uniref:CheR family methyltransferase n=1 Tax=Flammeovirga sp. SubArs3 TaxID=2995316 RepID=UPI00248AF6F9|nr:CheR family methyltransferase [Flammeovirga sp. SubArs3]
MITEQPKYIVGIGASAGGLEAIKDFFINYHADNDLSFIVVQHLSQDHKSLMSELLEKVTHLKIVEVNQDHAILRNHIYLINNHTTLQIKNNRIVVTERSDKNKTLTYPINLLFDSLAKEIGKKAIGIVLSGTGSDGSKGLKAVKDYGGITMVQHPDLAKFNGMPFSAIQAANPDYILSTKEMSNLLSDLTVIENGNSSEESIKNIEDIIDLVSTNEGIDFNLYKSQTLYRRILKMMEYQDIHSIKEYYDHLQYHPQDVKKLCNSFMIGVTTFFRDPEEWEFLEAVVLPKILTKDIIRIWSIGCSTGQEAYSIAILVRELLGNNAAVKDIKIFATDINENAIHRASEGFFSDSEIQHLPKKYQEKYFDFNGKYYEVKEDIRSIITFVQHDILSTPPFLNIDLITCRNLLIYLNQRTQNKILNTIKFSMNKGSFLFLGPSEKNFSDKYLEEINVKRKFFRLKEKFKIIDMDNTSKINKKVKKADQKTEKVAPLPTKYFSELERGLINYFCNSFIVLDTDENIIFSTDDIGKYLKFPKSELVLKETLEFEIYIDIIREVKKVIADGNTRRLKKLKINANSQDQSDIIIRRMRTSDGENLIIIEFSTSNDDKEEDIIDQDNNINNLKNEIKQLHLELKRANKKIEMINEDYQVNNEELMSSNEELQSSNEELQSVNEELYTVNQEYKDKLDEISILNDDFLNLFQSAGIASLYLDKDLKIRRIAPNASKFFGIEKEDIGRSILQFNTFFEIEDGLISIIDRAIKSKEIQEIEIKNAQNLSYLLRVSPIGSYNSKSDGIILSFIPISEFSPIIQLNKNVELYSKVIERTKALYEYQQIYSWSWQKDNNSFHIDEKAKKFINYNSYETFFWRSLEEQLSEYHKTEFTRKINNSIKDGSSFTISLSVGRYIIEFTCMAKMTKGKVSHLYGTIKDNTQSELNRKKLKQLASTYLELSDLDQFGTFKMKSNAEKSVKINDTLLNWFEFNSQEHNYSLDDIIEHIHPEDRGEFAKITQQKKFSIVVRFITQSKKTLFLKFEGVNKTLEKKDRTMLLAIVFDISDSKSLEMQWKETVNIAEKTTQTLALQNEQLESYTYIASHNIRSPLSNLLALMELYENEKSAEERENFIDLFRKALHQLEKTVNNLSDAIKVQQNISLERKDMLIKEELMKVMDVLSGQINKYGVLVSFDIERGLRINYPEEYLKSIFLNLMSNAIKYRSNERLPIIEVEAYEKDHSVFIEIKDNGIGIDLDKFSHRIFGMYQTFHANQDARGLGLFLTKNQIEATGGTIAVDSTVNQGTKFMITIPKEKI